jgi:Glycosyl transferase family 2
VRDVMGDGAGSAPGVSVALCTFNGEQFIVEQLRSIFAQSILPGELVVSDDGSTDRTVELVRAEFEASARRGDPVTTRLIQGDRPLGVVRNFERAMSATGLDLIALSDQDDVWAPARLERITREFRTRPSLEFLFSDARLVDDDGRPVGSSLFEALEISEADRRSINDGDAFTPFIRRNLATGATVVIRRRLLQRAMPFPDEWVHDEWLGILAAATGGVGFLPDPLIDYRRHGGNQIGVKDPTLANKVRRVLMPRGDRNTGLAERSAILAAKLQDLGAAVPDRVLETARGKARFEAVRAAMSDNRLARVPAIVRLAARGDYERFASRGRADIIRDALQPAGDADGARAG